MLAEKSGLLKHLEPEYPELAEGWKLLLLNQFHDIIPGTSIPEVYTTSREQYAEIFSLGQQVLDTSLRALASGVDTSGEGRPYVVFNSLGWERTELIRQGDSSLTAVQAFDEDGLLDSECWNTDGAGGSYTLAVRVRRVPAFGCRTFWLREAEQAGGRHEPQGQLSAGEAFPEQWETEHYILKFNEDGKSAAGTTRVPAGSCFSPGRPATSCSSIMILPLYGMPGTWTRVMSSSLQAGRSCWSGRSWSADLH